MNGKSSRYFDHCVLDYVNTLRSQRILHPQSESAGKTGDPNKLSSEIRHNEHLEDNFGNKRNYNPLDNAQFTFGAEKCQECADNHKLYFYSITCKPLLWQSSTLNVTEIENNGKMFRFDGFDLLTHFQIRNISRLTLKLNNMIYSLEASGAKEHGFTREYMIGLDGFTRYLYNDILELFDFYLQPVDSRIHISPRFVHSDWQIEVLPMGDIMKYLIHSFRLIDDVLFAKNEEGNIEDLFNQYKGAVVINPGKKPAAIRIDRLESSSNNFTIVHFTVRSKSQTYLDDKNYKQASKRLSRVRMKTRLKGSTENDHRETLELMNEMVDIKQSSSKRKAVAICLPTSGFYLTGLYNDVTQSAILLSQFVRHIYHSRSLSTLESSINYKFRNQSLLMQSLVPFQDFMRFTINVDQLKNSLSNVGNRYSGSPLQDKRNLRNQKGVLGLMRTMSNCDRLPEPSPLEDALGKTNERFELLGDAILEIIVSIDLFNSFPHHRESVLSAYRSALVGNSNLFKLADRLDLKKYILANNTVLVECEHILADAIEALVGKCLHELFFIGAIYVDCRSFPLTRQIVREIIFGDRTDAIVGEYLRNPPNPFSLLDSTAQLLLSDENHIGLDKLQCSMGIFFKRIDLLALALHKGGNGNNIFIINNERMEFLGDSVLKFVIVEYLYYRFPLYSEGPLSILKSLLVSSSVQSVICDELGLWDYQLLGQGKHEGSSARVVKHKADLFEAFVAAVYLDSGEFSSVVSLCKKRLFSKLNTFIYNQDWNDPKTLLKQCCHMESLMNNTSPSSPSYSLQPYSDDSTVFRTDVCFMGRVLANGVADTLRQSQVNAAKNALELDSEKFQLLVYRQRLLEKGLKRKHAPLSAS